MNFDRHDRVRSVLTELVASFIRLEANPNPLITVTNLNISPDYRYATVFITTIPNGGEDVALIFLKRKGRELRQFAKKHTHLKIIPSFSFEVDYGERHRQHIDEITNKLDLTDTQKKEGETGPIT